MKRRFNWDKKYLYWGITAFCVVACAILFYMALNYLPLLGKAFSSLFAILSPFVWGLVISYLLAPLMRASQKHLFDPLCARSGSKNKKKKKSGKLSRALAVLLSELVFLAVLVALVYLILPQLYNSILTIVSNSNSYIEKTTQWLERFLQNYPEVEQYAISALGNLNEGLGGWLRDTLLPKFGSLLANFTVGVYGVFKALYNLIIGIIVSVYILGGLENFSANAKKLMYSLFKLETAEKLRAALAFTDKTFMGFINGKLLDSAIIGLICYIVCAILRIPYALLVSVIVGVTNVIPFFGPIIGAIPSALIILLVDPLKCLIFIIFVIILQQVDGNFIGPKILGNSIGINGFWVMFSIILGAGLFGFWGMLLGVPVFVVIYTGITNLIDRRLKKSDLPWEAADYLNVEYIDPITHEIVKKEKPEK